MTTLYLHLTQLPSSLLNRELDYSTSELSPENDLNNGLWQSQSLAGPWQATTLTQLAKELSLQEFDTELVLFIPAHHVVSTRLTVAANQRKHLSKILPFLCEDALGCDPDQIHISHAHAGDDSVDVRILDKTLLANLHGLFKQQRLNLQAVYSDAKPLRHQLTDQHVLLWLEPQRFLWITAEGSVETTLDNLTPLLNTLVADCTGADTKTGTVKGESEATQQQVLVVHHENIGLHPYSTALEMLKAAGCQVKEHILAAESHQHTLLGFSLGLDDDIENLPPLFINLLSGPFSPPRRASKHKAPIKGFAIAAAICVAVTLIYQLASGWYFQQQANELAQQSEALYRDYFPQDRRIIDIRKQTQSHLRLGGNTQSSGFFQLLGRLAPQWQTQTASLQLNSLRYNQQRQEMLLDLDSKTIAQLDQLQQTLGNQADLLSANELPQGGVRGRLRISGQ